jgi:hypothetical protein
MPFQFIDSFRSGISARVSKCDGSFSMESQDGAQSLRAKNRLSARALPGS